MSIDPSFDGHPERDFQRMTAEERLDDLSRKIALVLELRSSGAGSLIPPAMSPPARTER